MEEYKYSEPKQLELFLLIEPEEQQYSNTIELYDFLPKYFVINGRSTKKVVPPAIERRFEFRGQLYTLTIKPARIKNKLGNYINCYPGEREEIIEDALRKMACEHKFPFLDNLPSVAFTIYQLRKHLKDVHHSFTHAEIVEALNICVDTTLEIKSIDGKTYYHTHIFQSLYLNTREDAKNYQKKSFVRLNELVANSIQYNTFRMINYDNLVTMKNPLARRFYKRLSHLYTYANFFEPDNSYSLLLSTILRDFALTPYADIRNNIREVKKALDELKEKGVISSYTVEKANNPQFKGDVKFMLKAGYGFGHDMKRANQKQLDNKAKLSFPE
jgi:hypothetical protein